MKRMKHRRKRKRMETGVLVLLIIFLAAFIRFYPTESEDRGNLKDNVTEAVKNARETLTASAAEVQQTQKIKTGNVPQRTQETSATQETSGTQETSAAQETSGTQETSGQNTPTTEVPQEVEFHSTAASGETMTNAETTTGTTTGTTTETNAEFTTGTTTETNAETNEPSRRMIADKTSDLMTSSVTKTASEIFSEMSLSDKIYQMMFVRPEAITGVTTATAASDATRAALQKYPVGGIVYSKSNMLSKEQLASMISHTKSYAKVPLFIATDEEGGKVNRLMDSVGTTKVDSPYSYKDNGINTASCNAKIIANDMNNLGFNLNFAPVADVWSNPNNAVIAQRAYSNNFREAGNLVDAAVRGFHEGGVCTTLKHFPGHGDTYEDTHTSTAYVSKSRDQLENEELQVFRKGIEAGTDLVMVGHMIVENIDNTAPASLSEKVVTELLRNEMNFTGLIITDSLEMNAVSEHYTGGEAAVRAIKAGNDLLLEPKDLNEAVMAVMNAVSQGEITEQQINEHVLRILEVKERAGIL
ncbi:glycoside hydrolase family 3 protein [Ruminococcus sp. AF41-9]|nr:glycoside hydrolase family 3 protein [Ruminococcus sp. AF41-9]